jgi:hypothetical protein
MGILVGNPYLDPFWLLVVEDVKDTLPGVPMKYDNRTFASMTLYRVSSSISGSFF